MSSTLPRVISFADYVHYMDAVLATSIKRHYAQHTSHYTARLQLFDKEFQHLCTIVSLSTTNLPKHEFLARQLPPDWLNSTGRIYIQ